jgi:hypothetical protein
MSKKRKRAGKRIYGNPDINRIKKHKFPQGNYKIHWKKPKDNEGECSDPKDRQMWINPKLDDQELLRVSIDESLHASLWAIDNDIVYEIADCMGEFLYKLGFRLEKKNKNTT